MSSTAHAGVAGGRLVRDIVDKELRPLVDEAERAHSFPREVFRTLGRAAVPYLLSSA